MLRLARELPKKFKSWRKDREEENRSVDDDGIHISLDDYVEPTFRMSLVLRGWMEDDSKSFTIEEVREFDYNADFVLISMDIMTDESWKKYQDLFDSELSIQSIKFRVRDDVITFSIKAITKDGVPVQGLYLREILS